MQEIIISQESFMEKIKKIIEEVFQQMGFGPIKKIELKKDSSLREREALKADIEIQAKEADFFLKENGLGLTAIQHILRLLISKKISNQPLFILDINNHRKKREKDLAELASKAAQKARKTKKPVILDPMPAYERRIVHLKLAEQPDIVTESTGQEPERKIVVRPYP